MKLALIGKNIQHSKSPELYKKLIGPNITYELIDVSDEKKLPTIEELKEHYNGINITSPFKKSYIGKLEVDEAVNDLGAINTISFTEKVLATNTDYYALQIILSRFKIFKAILLGNGSMAQLTQKILKQLEIELIAHFYRSKDGEISHLDLTGINSSPVLIINSCSRDFIFKGKLPANAVFFDYNYNFSPHHYLDSTVIYQDGLELLELQAQAAVEFWNRTQNTI